MKPIPNPRDLGPLRGTKYSITSTTPTGRPLRVSFSCVRGGPLDCVLVKSARVQRLEGEAAADGSWYLRFQRPDGRRAWLQCGECGDIEGALAKAIVTLAELRSGDVRRFDQYLSAVGERASLTVGTLTNEWISKGYPRPDGRPRTPAEVRGFLQYFPAIRRWWDSVGVTAINRGVWDEYVAHRRSQVAQRFAESEAARGVSGGARRPPPTGDRAVDLECNVLRCLFAWAVATERHRGPNPFVAFPRCKASSEVVSCNAQMPETDEEFHRISAHLFGTGEPSDRLVAGAQLLFQGLTGLRPGEPGALRWDSKAGSARHAAGLIYSVTLGQEVRTRLAVSRLKGGMTPYVAVHPALADFISAWTAFHASHWPQSPWWFPSALRPDEPLVAFGQSNTSRLSRYVAEAVEGLRSPYRRPHAWRAYYVRVRRSQDTNDGQIADELGERSGECIVRSTYGDPDGVRGDGLFDWLPSTGTPAWARLKPSESPALLTPAFGG